MIDLLEQLSLAVGPISKTDVRQLNEAINRKVMTLLGAQLVKTYWLEEAEDGILLRPMTFINDTHAEDPKPFQMREQPNGILSWVFHRKCPVWLEMLQVKDLSSSIKNEANGAEVHPDYLDMRGRSDWMDSMMCVPLMVRGDVRGLYSVELQVSGRLNKNVLDLLQRIGKSLSSLLWNADVYEYDQEKTTRAVQQFLASTASFSFDAIFLEEQFRSGFIARPFDKDSSEIEDKLVALFKSRGIRARRYVPAGGRRYVIDDIMSQIRNSHFGVADITGLNPNVMTEVGMMMSLKKQFMLIRAKGDSSSLPFDVNQFPLYEYELGSAPGSLRMWNPVNNRYQSFEEVLDRFIRQLPSATGFFSADAWMSQNS
jgi:hypothetical protein